MLSDLEKAYEYLLSHDLIAAFVHNCETANSKYKPRQVDSYPSFVRNAFRWAETSEYWDFWNDHDEAILKLRIKLSATDVLNYIQQYQSQPQPYEYW